MSMSDIIAVYGTLRKGCRANHLLNSCEFLGTDTVKGTMFDLSAYPAFRRTNTENEIVVELYKLPEKGKEGVVSSLDRYEGYNPQNEDQSLYRRLTVLSSSGKEVNIYEYLHPTRNEDIIRNGDWMKRHDNKN